MLTKLRIAVIGAGLGGTTAAIFLQRAGYDVRIYEQTPALARVGAGISLGPNVLKVMRQIGIADQLLSIGIVAEVRLSREWDTGRILNKVQNARYADVHGEVMMSMHRGDFLSVLASHVKPGSIYFNKKVIDLHEGASQSTIVFEDGTTAEADLIIGADGVNSKIREILLGVEPPVYTGFVAYRALFPTSRLGDFRLTADHTKWWTDERHFAGEDRHFIIYYLTKKRDEVYFVTGSPAPDWDPSLSSVPVDIVEIKKCYEGFHPEVQWVIDACPAATKWPLLERKPLPLWSRGNVVLLGDACHPMKPHMGQGAGMAIEDAAILARSIQGASNISAALRLYEHNRKHRTSLVQEASHVNTWLKYPTDTAWVYGYDAMNVPLESSEPTVTPSTIPAA